MKKYVVGILSFFDNEVKLYQVEAEDEFDALKQGMVLLCDGNPEAINSELEWQASDAYPSDLDGLQETLNNADISASILELK